MLGQAYRKCETPTICVCKSAVKNQIYMKKKLFSPSVTIPRTEKSVQTILME